MKLIKPTYRVIILTAVLSAFAYLAYMQDDRIKELQNNNDYSIEEAKAKYNEHDLVKAFFATEAHLKLPAEDFYKKIRSFDSNNTFIENDSSSNESIETDIGVQSFKTFKTKDNTVELVVSTISNSPYTELKNPNEKDIFSVKLTFIQEELSLYFINYSNQTDYIIEKSYNQLNKQNNSNTSIMNTNKYEEAYFKISSIVSKNKNLSIKEIEEEAGVLLNRWYNDENLELYSYGNSDDSVGITVEGGKITSINCTSLNDSTGSPNKNIELEYAHINSSKDTKLTTRLTTTTLEDMLELTKLL